MYVVLTWSQINFFILSLDFIGRYKLHTCFILSWNLRLRAFHSLSSSKLKRSLLSPKIKQIYTTFDLSHMQSAIFIRIFFLKILWQQDFHGLSSGEGMWPSTSTTYYKDQEITHKVSDSLCLYIKNIMLTEFS